MTGNEMDLLKQATQAMMARYADTKIHVSLDFRGQSGDLAGWQLSNSSAIHCGGMAEDLWAFMVYHLLSSTCLSSGLVLLTASPGRWGGQEVSPTCFHGQSQS